MWNRWIFLSLVWILCNISLVGCKPPPTFDMTKAEIANTENKIHLKEAEDIPPPAPVITMSGAYVDTERVSLTRAQAWLQQHLVIHGNKLPFIFYVDQILGDTGARISYDKTIDKKMPLSLEYSGNVRGALDELATMSGYHYEIDNKANAVNWTALVTKVFSIKFIPGTSNYEIGQTLNLESSSASSSSGGDMQAVQDSQYSRLSGNVSVWKDIEDTVKSLLSDQGSITVSQGTTTITVKDHPENVAAVEKYVNKINYELGKQVRIQVQILEVQLSDQFAYGINWEVVRSFISNSSASALALVSPGYTNVNLSSLTPTAFTFAAEKGDFAGTKTIVNALQQQGTVSIVTQPSVTTLNNQVAQISIQELQNYVSGSNVSQNDNGNTGGPETATVTTGLSMYILPKVNKDKIYLQISSLLSKLVSLDSYNVFTGGDGEETSQTQTSTTTQQSGQSTDVATITAIANALTANTIPSFVQLPKVNASLLNQRAVLKNGSTLILAGYKQFQNNANNNKFFDSDKLGAQSADRENREIVFLITPVIIDEEEYFEDNS